MTLNFESLAKVIEGYFEFLSFIPNFKNLKLESVVGSENYLTMVISETSGVLKLTMPVDIYKEPSYTEKHKTTITINLALKKEIIKGEINAVKPE